MAALLFLRFPIVALWYCAGLTLGNMQESILGHETAPIAPHIKFSNKWQILGPFKIGTREAIWGADPLERNGGFQSFHYDPYKTFPTPLAPNGSVSWRTILSSNFERSSQNSEAHLDVSFSDIDWSFLVSIYGWAAMQYQAWARGYLENFHPSEQRIELFTDGVLELRCNNDSFFGGDMYRFRKSPIILSLKPGKNVLDIRLFRDVRSMGGRGDPSTELLLEANLAENEIRVASDTLLISEKVNGRLPSQYASTVLRNTGDKVALAWIGRCFKGLKSVATISHDPMLLYPGQTRAFDVVLQLEAEETTELSFGISVAYRSEHGAVRSATDTIIISAVVSEKSIYDPHRFTFLHPSGTVSYAILRPPLENESIPTNKKSLPVLLSLHGAGVEADSDQARHTLDGARDLMAWTLFPSGMTDWSGDDWHAWGFADVKAAVAAIPQWIEAVGWKWSNVDLLKWLVTGHSNGGQGTWYIMCHDPDKIIAGAPVSGYSSIQNYVPYVMWTEDPPLLSSVITSALSSFKHELLVPNLSGIPILLQHGSKDDNVPTYHSRLMHALLTEVSPDASYVEIPGAGHWFDGVMTTKDLTNFYKSHLGSSMDRRELPLNFTFVVANSDDFGSRGGLSIDQITSPDSLAKIAVNRDNAGSIWWLSTSNVHRFSFDLGSIPVERPRYLMLDHQEWDLPSNRRRTMFAKNNQSIWTRVEDRESWKNIGQRYGRQRGTIDAILRTKGSFCIRIGPSPAELAIGLQISRNLFQYFRADSEISHSYRSLDKPSSGNVISVGIGTDYRTLGQDGSHPISIEADEICFVFPKATFRKCYRYRPGLGAIFLQPLEDERLELVVWGIDEAGLRQAARLVPTLTGAGQPDFVVLDDDCRWKGHAAVLAAGFLDYSWQVSAGSYFV